MVGRRSVGIEPATAVAIEHGPLMCELQSATPLKSEFVATLSHRIRTPLDSITGYSEMLTDATLEPYSPQWDDVIGRIQLSVRELLEGLNITLDFVRLQVDELVPASDPQEARQAAFTAKERPA